MFHRPQLRHVQVHIRYSPGTKSQVGKGAETLSDNEKRLHQAMEISTWTAPGRELSTCPKAVLSATKPVFVHVLKVQFPCSQLGTFLVFCYGLSKATPSMTDGWGEASVSGGRG